MTELKQIYKCDVCGNIVEILNAGVGELVCCNKPMRLITEKTKDLDQEKHVPIIEKTEKGFLVKIGSIQHPMEKEHYIQWIELIEDGIVYRKELLPGDKPVAEFQVIAEDVFAREFCNLHELWVAKLS